MSASPIMEAMTLIGTKAGAGDPFVINAVDFASMSPD